MRLCRIVTYLASEVILCSLPCKVPKANLTIFNVTGALPRNASHAVPDRHEVRTSGYLITDLCLAHPACPKKGRFIYTTSTP